MLQARNPLLALIVYLSSVAIQAQSTPNIFAIAVLFGQPQPISLFQADAAGKVLPELKTEETSVERFSTMMTFAKASGGIAIIYEGCAHGPKRNILIKEGTTLGQALDSFASDTRSKWQISDGVINMLPGGAAPAFLETPIHSFEWNRSRSIAEAVACLRGLPEITRRARELGLKQEPGGASSTGVCIRDCPKEPDPVIEVEKDTTLLTILNHIVRSRQGALWGYFESQYDNQRRFSLVIMAE